MALFPAPPTMVALRKESVDRNSLLCGLLSMLIVALRKESVDRNFLLRGQGRRLGASLSVRRAWIEISGSTKPNARRAVALRKESVDRNCYAGDCTATKTVVALRKESVDRNYIIKITKTPLRRSLSVRRAWIEMVNGVGLIIHISGRSP